MKFLSVCSGIEAASVAWQPLGWEAVAFSEIEPFPCAVLAHHYPDTPNWGDMTKFKEWPDVAIDLLCGGTPCQSFSVAGLRAGLADPRGNLMLTYLAIAAKYRPQWVVWENVPGVLSSWSGDEPPSDLEEGQEWESVETSDFGSFLAGLGELGYGYSYRVFDAQYFGVAQRRRRVFVVGCLGDWRSAAAVLFERHSLQGNPAPRREAEQVVTPTIRAGAANGGAGHGAQSGDSKDELIVPVTGTLQANGKSAGSATQQDAESGLLLAVPHATTSPAIKARDYKGASSDGDGDGGILVPMLAHSLRGEGFDASEDGTGRGTPLVPVAFSWQGGGTQTTLGYAPESGVAGSLSVGQTQAVAFDSRMRGAEPAVGREERPPQTMIERTGAIDATKPWNVAAGMQVRRLTPKECARLQGFPDAYLDITVRGKPAADGPKYKALGNSWAVPNVAWIGRRIDAVSEITKNRKAA